MDAGAGVEIDRSLAHFSERVGAGLPGTAEWLLGGLWILAASTWLAKAKRCGKFGGHHARQGGHA